VTDGVALLVLGAEEFPDEVPEPSFVDEEDPATVVVVTLPEPVDLFAPVVLVLPAPGCSRATTMPRATVAPVATNTATRVSERSRDVVFSRWSGALGI
jgi:hypothetical protein